MAKIKSSVSARCRSTFGGQIDLAGRIRRTLATVIIAVLSALLLETILREKLQLSATFFDASAPFSIVIGLWIMCCGVILSLPTEFVQEEIMNTHNSVMVAFLADFVMMATTSMITLILVGLLTVVVAPSVTDDSNLISEFNHDYCVKYATSVCANGTRANDALRLFDLKPKAWIDSLLGTFRSDTNAQLLSQHCVIVKTEGHAVAKADEFLSKYAPISTATQSWCGRELAATWAPLQVAMNAAAVADVSTEASPFNQNLQKVVSDAKVTRARWIGVASASIWMIGHMMYVEVYWEMFLIQHFPPRRR